jgi:hypothetical protein
MPRLFVLLAAALSTLLTRSLGSTGAELYLSLLLLVGVILVGSRYPGPVLVGVVVLVPLQVALLAGLYGLGVPGSLIRALGLLKEAAVAALILAALGGPRRDRGSRLESVATAYIALAGLFVVLPALVGGVLYDIPLQARIVGWRTACLGLVLLLAVRRLELPDRWRRWVIGAVVVTGAVMGFGALWNGLLPHSFDAFSVRWLHVRQYQIDILGSRSSSQSVLVPATGSLGTDFRAGSFLYDPLNASFYLLIPFGLLAARFSSRAQPAGLLAFGLVSAGILLSGTRSSVLAALVATLVLVLRSGGAAQAARTAVVLVVLAVLVAGGLGATFRERLGTSSRGDTYSTQQHHVLSTKALEDVIRNPLGRGLGTAPGVGKRFAVQGRVTSENFYLQVGIETGVMGILLFASALALSLVAGWHSRSVVGMGVLVAGVALGISGLFLHTWEDLSVSLTYWAIVAVCASSGERTEQREMLVD